jgi:hypothetical protein
MEEKFYCSECKITYTAEGIKKEWNDPIYGPCMKFMAYCPACTKECNEYRDPNAQKKTATMPAGGCGGQCTSCEYAN